MIPSQVALIGEGAFHCCKNLRQVEFPNDSNLPIIDESAFSESSIERIKIPPQVS